MVDRNWLNEKQGQNTNKDIWQVGQRACALVAANHRSACIETTSLMLFQMSYFQHFQPLSSGLVCVQDLCMVTMLRFTRRLWPMFYAGATHETTSGVRSGSNSSSLIYPSVFSSRGAVFCWTPEKQFQQWLTSAFSALLDTTSNRVQETKALPHISITGCSWLNPKSWFINIDQPTGWFVILEPVGLGSNFPNGCRVYDCTPLACRCDRHRLQCWFWPGPGIPKGPQPWI